LTNAVSTSSPTAGATGYDVFLSHNGADKAAVQDIALRLRQAGIEPFFDKWHLVPGEAWQEALERALDESRTCAVFLGPKGFGPWENVEMRAALSRRVADAEYRVIPVLLPGAALPERGRLPRFLAQVTWVDFRPGLDDAAAFDRLVSGIRGLAPETGAEGTEAGSREAIVCPFRGLEVFDEAHAEYFFGREALTQHLVEQLRADRFLAVLGASGSGKSSVVRAGLIPELRRGALPGSADWDVVLVRPGPNPMETLATRLVGLVGPGGDALGTRASILETLNRDERGLHTIVQLAVDGGSADDRVVIVVDQFEEIFTLVHDDTERSKFVAALLYASSVAGGPTVVVTTMRADFFGKCAAIPGLAARLSERDVLVAPMVPEELRQAMILPAEKVGLQFEKGLVDTILADVGTEPGSLPLLQHTLLELFEGRRGRWLTIDHYRAIGGVKGAIAKRAETIYERLSPAQQAAARRILLRLTQPGEGTEDTRRRASVMELVPAGSGGESVEAVVNELAEARLLTTSREESGQEIVDVAHEALIRGWPRLHSWVAENPVALRIHRDLTRAAEAWADNNRERSFLFAGPRLDETAAFAARNPDDLNELERSFVTASKRARQTRTFRLVALAAAASIVVAALGGMAFIQADQANRSAEQATRAAAQASTNALLSSSVSAARESPATALRVSTEALVRGEELGMDLTQLRNAVTGMLDTGRYAYLPGPIEQAWTDPGGRIIVVAPADGPARITDTGDGRVIAELPGTLDSVTFSGHPDAGLFVLSYDDRVEVRRLADGSIVDMTEPILDVAIDDGQVGQTMVIEYAGVDDENSEEVVVAAPSEIRSVVDGSLVRKLAGPASSTLLAPGAERFAAVSYEAGGVGIVRLSDGSEVEVIESGGGASVEPSPRGQTFVLSDDADCSLHSLDPRSELALGEFCGAEFSPDGGTLVGYGEEGLALFDVRAARPLARIDGPWSVQAFSPTIPADTIVLGTEEETRLVSTGTGKVLTKLDSGVPEVEEPAEGEEPAPGDEAQEPAVRYSPDGSLVFIDTDQTQVLVSSRTGETVLEGAAVPMTGGGPVVGPEGVVGLDFSSDGEWLWVAMSTIPAEVRPTSAPTASTGLTSEDSFWPGSDGALAVGWTGLRRIDASGATVLVEVAEEASMDVLAFEPGEKPEIAVVTFEDENLTTTSAALLDRDGTLRPLDGPIPVEASFSADEEHRFVLLKDNAGHVTIWDRVGEPVLLASIDGLSLATWAPDGRWLLTSSPTGDAYLIDLEWLSRVRGADRSEAVDWLEARVCDGPVRRLVEDAALEQQLGERPHSCQNP
jgi:WD40 repeat protein